jgi:hypothetical protein
MHLFYGEAVLGQAVYIFFLILLLGQEFAQFLIKPVIAYANYWLKLKKSNSEVK